MALLQIKKRLMALAGMVLTIYLVIHMLVNLSFVDPATFNQVYALYNQPLIRWPVWIVMVIALALHVWVAVQIRRHNRKARPIAYYHRQHHWIPSWLVSIVISLILAFMIYHLAQMWFFGGADIHGQTRKLFAEGHQVLIYLAGLGLMALHLGHALPNVLQTLGKTSKQYLYLCLLLVALLIGGFAVVPIMAFWSTP
ncbi:Succinate dehydrogenase cytochrome b subunit [Methylophaga frappieri]|uniref:Succinate dehydrogenase cytochrome b subunit n=1 Tax=Methylophaga frappieri (strain ATCC BAA-2434 / DSM 25690 / JAM7) TaxID=754477 RepID=I1YET7_METFJ|nr:succinate dehydrogenase [Methylophaga frappieri]AFJ01430.1 Succinate dehydrogenase cytochrome b subunit [Methylophaga frappieri]